MSGIDDLGMTTMATRAVEKVRRYDPVETRQRVLEAANRLFTTKGFVATGTADIARDADVSEGSIFYHFGSKKKLLEELGRLYGERMVAAMCHPGEVLGDVTPDVAIRRCFDYCIANKSVDAHERVAVDEGGDCQLVAKASHEHAPETEPFYRAARSVVVEWSEANMRAMNARFGISGIDEQVASSLMYAAVHEAVEIVLAPGMSDAARERVIVETVRFVGSAVCPLQLAARAAA